MKEGFYSIGEFALLCNTSKETLHHYNQIGLLKPAGRTEHGYRLYTLREFFLFQMIRIFHANGCSLSEIQQFLETGNTQDYITILEKHKEELSAKAKSNPQTINMLDHCIRFMKRSLMLPTNVPIITMQTSPQYLFVTPCPTPVIPSDIDYKDLLFHHLVALSTIPSAIKYPVGGIISKESFENNQCGLSYFFSASTKELDGNHAKLLPAGKYVSYIYESSHNEMEKAYQTLHEYIWNNHLEVSGDLYEFGLLDGLSIMHNSSNITQIHIPIK